MADARIRQQAFMLDVAAGARLCVLREPARGGCAGLVVHVPAFAEEMNKSRRMVAWCARELAARGYCVLQFDPLGTGDSSGDFADASWDAWREDLRVAIAWLRRERGGGPAGGDKPLWLWAHRAGALLAAAELPALLADRLRVGLLLWQPVVSGSQHLAQFLRLAVTADALALGGDREKTAGLKRALTQGDTVEIAGYRLSAPLASGLGAAKLELPASFAGPLACIEVAGAPAAAAQGAAVLSPEGRSADLSPAAAAALAPLRAAGGRVEVAVVEGPRFWQTVEIEDCPRLVEATLAALDVSHEHRLDRAAAAA